MKRSQQLWNFSVTACLLFGSVLGYLEDPPTTADPSTISDCSYWAVVDSSSTCQGLADDNGITLSQFQQYNPSVGTSCKLVVGNSYCVEENYGVPPTSTTTTSSTSSKPTAPNPTQTGQPDNCNKWYTVVDGDNCDLISQKTGVSSQQIIAWNPAIGSGCTNLWISTSICIGTTDSTTTTTTTTTTGNGISTPTPYQTPFPTNCNAFHLVASGDQCQTIADNAGISLTNFYAWNPAINAQCTNILLGFYVCTGVIGSTTTSRTTTSRTTTTTNNGISTPTPTQTGMATNCRTFAQAGSGAECQTLADQLGISLAQFYARNPAVGSTCSYLYLGYYYCGQLIGETIAPTTTTTLRTTTTTSSNGVVTPTPYQANMTKSCKTFYLVKANDGCQAIADAYKITVANFYSWNPDVNTGGTCAGLWLGYYVCVGV